MGKLCSFRESTLVGLADIFRERFGLADKLDFTQMLVLVNETLKASKGDCDESTTIFKNKVVGRIGKALFKGSKNLHKVDIPSVKYIDAEAFKDCINLPDFTLSQCQNIGRRAFQNCQKLTEVCGESIVGIGEEAFAGCSVISSASLPACKYIASQAFAGCPLLSFISLPAIMDLGTAVFASIPECSVTVGPNLQLTDAAFQFAERVTLTILYDGKHSAALRGPGLLKNVVSIYVPAQQFRYYTTASYWSNYSHLMISYK